MIEIDETIESREGERERDVRSVCTDESETMTPGLVFKGIVYSEKNPVATPLGQDERLCFLNHETVLEFHSRKEFRANSLTRRQIITRGEAPRCCGGLKDVTMEALT